MNVRMKENKYYIVLVYFVVRIELINSKEFVMIRMVYTF